MMHGMQRIKATGHYFHGPLAVEALWIENPVDLLYLTGLPLSKGTLWIDSQGAVLFVDGRYLSIASKAAPCLVKPEEELTTWLVAKKALRVGFDSVTTSYETAHRLQRSFPNVVFVPLPNLLQAQRAIKEAGEVEALRRAARLTKEGIQAITALLKEGVTEEEIALEFEIFCRRRGASGLSFEPIIAFGEEGAFPHHRSTTKKLECNQMVLVDVGAIVDGYRGDFTRMIHFGSPPKELLRREKLVARAQTAAIEAIAPGVRVGDLDQRVREIFALEGVEELFTHGLGHGIGLETHEFPRLKSKGEDRDVLLQPGMVITIEPGLYQVGLGGIRIEDMVFVTENGYTLL